MILNIILAIVTIGALYIIWKEPVDDNALIMIFSVVPGTWLAGRLGIKPTIGVLVLVAINVALFIIGQNRLNKAAVSSSTNSITETSMEARKYSSLKPHQTDENINEKNRYVINNAIAFVGLCSKLDVKKFHPVYFEFRTDNGLVYVYASHIFHDNALLEHAHNRAMEGDQDGVEYAYNQLIDTHGLTRAELRSFQDVSDFMDCLRGGIPHYNTCRRTGDSDIEITQILGTFALTEKHTILTDIESAILNSFSFAKVTFRNSSTIGMLI